MKTTRFKPSIHGWPFINSFRYSCLFGTVDLTMGFCGGMCWRALHRFFRGERIPRSTAAPQQGDPLYDELFDAQKASLPASTLSRIFDWQQSPDLSHWYRSHSLGDRTQGQWPDVRSRLDGDRPVTLTVLTTSNDGNIQHLPDNHRVVAYAYEERPLHDGEWVHGDRKSSIRHITIWIYDPNHMNDDDVRLTFFTGCDDNWIGMAHNRGLEVHGFFLDDKDRSYSSSDAPVVCIDSCVQREITSASLAVYDLKFSWRCRFIPYFRVLVDGVNWGRNDTVRSSLEPTGKDDKQASAMVGSLSLAINLPRALSRVTVRLLDADEYTETLEVDTRPGIECNAYVHTASAGSEGEVRDSGITDADLFIKEPNPPQADVEALDTSPFRWIRMMPGTPVVDHRGARDPRKTGRVEILMSFRLGNLVVPIFGEFVDRNLAAPITVSGTVKATRGGVVMQQTPLPALTGQSAKIWDGFKDNPADYDNDTTVDLTYSAKDRFGVVACGTAVFYGKSIIYSECATTVYTLDPGKLGKLMEYAQYLMERGLVDTAIELHHPPRPTDPEKVLSQIHSHQVIQKHIKDTMQNLWQDSSVWQEIWKAETGTLKPDGNGARIPHPAGRKGERVKRAVEIQAAGQRKYDYLVMGMFCDKGIEILRRDRKTMESLRKL